MTQHCVVDLCMKNTKEKILLAASKLFLKGGVSALSVRAIARESNLSTIGIYSHFNGKQGILDALYIEGFTRFQHAVDVPINSENPKESIMLATQGYIKTAVKYRGHYLLIFGESVADYCPSDEAKQSSVQAFLQTTKIIETILPKGASFEQKRNTTLQVWSIVHGYMGLMHHAIAEEIDNAHWEGLILDTVSLHIDALLKLNQPD